MKISYTIDKLQIKTFPLIQEIWKYVYVLYKIMTRQKVYSLLQISLSISFCIQLVIKKQDELKKKRSQLCTIDWKVLWQHSIIIQLWFLFALAATMWPKILWSRIRVFMSLWLWILHFIWKCINLLSNWKFDTENWFHFQTTPLWYRGSGSVWHLRSVWHKIKAQDMWKIFPLVPSKIFRLRQLRFSQFVNFLRELCLLFNVLVCIFLREREKIFFTYFRPKAPCLELAPKLVTKVVCCQKWLSSKTHKTFNMNHQRTNYIPNPRSYDQFK